MGKTEETAFKEIHSELIQLIKQLFDECDESLLLNNKRTKIINKLYLKRLGITEEPTPPNIFKSFTRNQKAFLKVKKL